ncbi:DUF4236 domain-containing protein [Gluconobacter morbifer]|uniref:DUF4236 domain-containing protein n=1 Tax=Gluconobacter morbifer G707 TaxID=1088869 RepID=G6XKB3_9PROT|nr:DUF4236 domain-containing protein [Gluconobacter morbifer]EHH67709.1 hypothetical protein GMO_19290 [Gluconobacter morbifer G707]
MPFYIRKSVSAGPFRFNFSKNGMGISAGVRGLRIGTGPRGHYVHAGRGGIYYRASIGRAGEKYQSRTNAPFKKPAYTLPNTDPVQMIEIESGDVLEMRNEAYQDILDELNAKRRQMRAAPLLFWATVIVAAVMAIFLKPEFILIGLLSPILWGVGHALDAAHRTTVLLYNLEDNIQTAFQQMTVAFDRMSKCHGKWHIEAGGAVKDLTTWKRNAGAAYLVKKKPTSLSYALPREIRCNITPPSLKVGKQTIYFLPDVALVDDGKKMGAIGYTDLQLRSQDSRFIEEGRVPSDAMVVDHTWKHPNKKGGPDKRFRVNPRLPICLYEALHLRSESGLQELVEFSKNGVAKNFIATIHPLRLKVVQAPEIDNTPQIPPPDETVAS